MNRLFSIIAIGGLVAGCSTASPSPSPTAVVTPEPTVSVAPSLASSMPTAAARLEPVCANGSPPPRIAQAHSANDGVSDPAGRIVFGRLIRAEDPLGQLVSLNAIDPDGSDLVQILDCETEFPRFSRDGSRLVFSIVMSDGSWQIATSAANGTGLRVIPSSTRGWADSVDLSPDGSWMIYAFAAQPCLTAARPCQLRSDFIERLWRMNAEGSDQRLIGNPDTYDFEPRISPDGTEVVFTRWSDNQGSADTRYTTMIRNLSTGAERQVVGSENKPEHPAWSPDGRWIIYNTYANGGRLQRIERVHADGPIAKPEVVYGDETHIAYKPVYSPDGSHIAFGCDGRLCTMNADGSNVVVLYAEPDVEINHFAWGVTPKAGT